MNIKENNNSNNSSLKEETLQKIDELIINTIQEKPKIIDGWTKGRWIDYIENTLSKYCLLYTSPSPRDRTRSRMPSSA